MFFGLPDPDPLFGGMDLDPDPDPSFSLKSVERTEIMPQNKILTQNFSNADPDSHQCESGSISSSY
jgi:hypothetical protein